MVQYVQPEVLTDLCASENNQNLGTLLVEVIASVLDNEVSCILLLNLWKTLKVLHVIESNL